MSDWRLSQGSGRAILDCAFRRTGIVLAITLAFVALPVRAQEVDKLPPMPMEVEPIPDWVPMARPLELGRELPARFSWHRYLPEASDGSAACKSADFNDMGDWGCHIDLTTPMRDQGHCGSCWAFATIGLLEAMWKIRVNRNSDGTYGPTTIAGQRWSPQQLVGCSPRGASTHTCHGGQPWDALHYLQTKGVVEDDCMPYVAGSFGFSCNYSDAFCVCSGDCNPDSPGCSIQDIDSDPSVTNNQCACVQGNDAGDPCPGYPCTDNTCSHSKFIQHGDASIYRIQAGDDTGTDWKKHIFAYGPIVVRMAVQCGFNGCSATQTGSDKVDPWIPSPDGADAYSDALASNDSNTFTRADCGSLKGINGAGARLRGWHAVVITGWDDNLGAWIVRNSWIAATGVPSKWFKSGYFKLDYDSACVGWDPSTGEAMADAEAIQFVFKFPDDDSDGDNVPDVSDNCPTVYNPGQENGDVGQEWVVAWETGDVCDLCTDWDGDGVGDPGTSTAGCPVQGKEDNCPKKPNPQQKDDDNDGVGNSCDECNGDKNAAHQSPSQCDNDNDGYAGIQQDNCPDLPNPEQVDTDGGGKGDVCDVCPGDSDESHQAPDKCNNDGDTMPNLTDLCPELASPNNTDSDGDGVGDPCDPCPDDKFNANPAKCDLDGDGVPDGLDNCQQVPNPDQNNQDDDIAGDACDACVPDPKEWEDAALCDNDLDNVIDSDPENPDNCLDKFNPDQSDKDGDGQGDLCDPCISNPDNPLGCDEDKDGLDEPSDNCPTVENPDQLDSDGDGKGDKCDKCPHDSTVSNDDLQECDLEHDGAPDMEDNCPGKFNANQNDWDGDGVGDACDTCPLDGDESHQSFGTCDDDGDGLPNALEFSEKPDVVFVDLDQQEQGEGKAGASGCSARTGPGQGALPGAAALLFVVMLLLLGAIRFTATRR